MNDDRFWNEVFPPGWELRSAATAVRYGRGRLGWDDAEECAQEAAKRLIAKPRFETVEEARRVYFGILRHVVQERLHHPCDEQLDSDGRAADDPGSRADRRHDFEVCLGHLTPRQLVTFDLRYVQGHTGREIAKILGVAEATVCRDLGAIRAAFEPLRGRE